MLWFREFVAVADAYTSASSASRRPANRERPSWMNRHWSSAVAPGARLVAAIAPAFTIGFVLPSPLASTAANELNGSPVLFTPSRPRTSSGPSASQTSAKTNGLETLMIENSTSASPTVVDVAARGDDADAEQVGRHAGERGIDRRARAVGVRAKRACASARSSRTRSAGGRCPVETNGDSSPRVLGASSVDHDSPFGALRLRRAHEGGDVRCRRRSGARASAPSTR